MKITEDFLKSTAISFSNARKLCVCGASMGPDGATWLARENTRLSEAKRTISMANDGCLADKAFNVCDELDITSAEAVEFAAWVEGI